MDCPHCGYPIGSNVSCPVCVTRMENGQPVITTHYHAGWNMPDYLPEADPRVFETRDEAQNYLYAELVRIADMIAEETDEDGPNSADAAIEELRAGADQVQVDECVYWIIPCDEVGEDHEVTLWCRHCGQPVYESGDAPYRHEGTDQIACRGKDDDPDRELREDWSEADAAKL